jgi:hypothetical protein
MTAVKNETTPLLVHFAIPHDENSSTSSLNGDLDGSLSSHIKRFNASMRQLSELVMKHTGSFFKCLSRQGLVVAGRFFYHALLLLTRSTRQ